MIDSHLRRYVQPIFDIAALGLASLGVSPNFLTLVGFGLGIGVSVCFFARLNDLALILLWGSGLFDILDGSVARKAARKSDFGGLLDIICDRLMECAFIFTVAFTYESARLSSVLLLCSIVFSFSVFLSVGALIKNKGEKAFLHQAGLAERTETFIIFSLVIIFPLYASILFYTFAGMIFYTGAQRMREAYILLIK